MRISVKPELFHSGTCLRLTLSVPIFVSRAVSLASEIFRSVSWQHTRDNVSGSQPRATYTGSVAGLPKDWRKEELDSTLRITSYSEHHVGTIAKHVVKSIQWKAHFYRIYYKGTFISLGELVNLADRLARGGIGCMTSAHTGSVLSV